VVQGPVARAGYVLLASAGLAFVLIGGGLAILAGLAAWFAASRPGIEAIVALSAGAFVLASGIPEPPAMDRRP
jgi:hypothetical protein